MWDTWDAVVRDRVALARAGQRHGLQRPERRRRRPRRHPRGTSRYLARHPATAQRIARKLRVKFVRDDPPAGAGRPPRAGLPRSTTPRSSRCCGPWSTPRSSSASAGRRCATPARTWSRRTAPSASGCQQAAASDDSAANAHPVAGHRPRRRARRLAAARRAAASTTTRWASPSRLMASMEVHCAMSGGWWPDEGHHLQRPGPWLPEVPDPVRRARRPPVPACCCTGGRPPRCSRPAARPSASRPRERITRDHGVVQWGMPRLLTTFLDSPAFLTGDRHDDVRRPPRHQPCCAEFAALSRRGCLTGAAALAGASTVDRLGGPHGLVRRRGHRSRHARGRCRCAVPPTGCRWSCRTATRSTTPPAPGIAIPPTGCWPRTASSGCTPQLAPLLPLWNAGKLAAVHATGLPAPNRSHFAAMEEVEDADPGSTPASGWLNRLVGTDAERLAAPGLQRRRRRRAGLALRPAAGHVRRRRRRRCRSRATTSGTRRTGALALAAHDVGPATTPRSAGRCAATFRRRRRVRAGRETRAAGQRRDLPRHRPRPRAGRGRPGDPRRRRRRGDHRRPGRLGHALRPRHRSSGAGMQRNAERARRR